VEARLLLVASPRLVVPLLEHHRAALPQQQLLQSSLPWLPQRLQRGWS
jgi:hypothetical protein